MSITAILVKMLDATDSKPKRMKAICPQNTSVVADYDESLPAHENAKRIARLKCKSDKYDFLDACVTANGFVVLFK